MRRLSGVLLAGAIFMLPAISQNLGSANAQQAAAPQKFTMEGDLAIWSVAVKPDKTADYEAVLAAVKDALAKSERPDAKQQAAGWKVIKLAQPANGNVVYTHIITPVPGADYSPLQVIYEVVKDPAAQRALYDKYRDAFAANLGLSSGKVAADFSK